ncbi:MAG: histidine kinase [Candidatus Hydromicrobium americanum]|nr:MAG: histidine kinase [Candidatus Hydromicrobium americanum]
MSGDSAKLNNNSSPGNPNRNIMDIPVRIAVYDNMRSIPRIIDLNFNDINNFINETSEKTYNLSHEIGGRIPYTIIKEIIENLIHADFKEVIITVLDSGNHIIVTDQGPGIEDKEKAFLPGYTSATSKMKEYIRGVGSGFPIIKETITFSGGSIDVKDNIKRGTVISLKLGLTEKSEEVQGSCSEPAAELPSDTVSEEKTQTDSLDKFNGKILSDRQKKILFVILELEEAGPSTIAKELGFSLSTSYRELIYLEKNKLLTPSSSGKRRLSKKGIKYLEYYSNNI